MHAMPDGPLVYLVTQGDLSAGRSTPEIVSAAIDGGVDIVQLREKDRPARERYRLGRELRELTAEAGVPLIVNDRVDIARAIDADGVHLGDADLPVDVARNQLGPDAIVGRSVSTPSEARAAAEAGADYLGAGTVFETSSKDTDPAIGIDGLAAVCAATDRPAVGIGGIDAENASRVVDAGAAGVAVISAITTAEDPRDATERLSSAVRNG